MRIGSGESPAASVVRKEYLAGKRILFVVNNPEFFLSHRLDLGREAKRRGMDVHVATPATVGWKEVVLEGFGFHQVPMTRSKWVPWQEAWTLLSLARLYRRLRPDIVHHVTIKPVLYGSLAARVLPATGVVNAISGLGTVFIARGLINRLRRFAVKIIYRLAFAHSRHRAIFQNPDDMGVFASEGILKEGDGIIIKGSGVDPERFRPRAEPAGVPTVALVSRMLWDKGVGEYVSAVRMLKAKGVSARFILVGDSDEGNPTSVPASTLEAWKREGVVEWWGKRNDMPEVLAQCHLICLPSYREGLPKSLIEAAACGLAVVTTDVPGCRDIVVHGRNGLLVPVRESAGLADALEALVLDGELRRRMGAEGRAQFERGFSVKSVTDQTMQLYGTLLEPSGRGA